jgi:hypothetical protein
MANRFIAPAGLGKADGSTIDDAAPFKAIGGQVKLAGPGGRVLLRPDKGDFSGAEYIWIENGGAPGKPVTIKGVDDRVVKVTGKRSPTDFLSKVGRGKPGICLKPGADYLNFTGFDVQNIGDGFVCVLGAVKGLTVANIKATNVRQLVNVANDVGALDGFTIKNIKAWGFSKALFELWRATNGTVIDVNADSQRQDGDPFCFGLFADGDSHDVTVTRMVVRNIRNTPLIQPPSPDAGKPDQTKYWNGDGFSLEGATSRFTFEDCHVYDVEDGGFDLKGTDQTVHNCSAEGVKRGVRVWGKTNIDGFVAARLVKRGGIGGRAGVWMHAGGSVTTKSYTHDPAFPRFDVTDGKCSVTDLDVKA